MLKKLSVVFGFAILATGCVRENLEDCPEVRLVFRYTWNNENVDRLTAHVRDIDVYVFDTNSRLLSEVIEVSPADIVRGWIDIDDLPDGDLTFVAWGGSGSDVSSNFTTTYDRNGSRAGNITLDEFYMTLDSDELPAGSAGENVGEIVPEAENFDDLFFAKAGGVSIEHGSTNTVELDFVRNTNVLKITVTGLEYLWNHNGGNNDTEAVQPLDVFAVGRNGSYRWDNAIDADGLSVLYRRPYSELTADTMRVDIKTMRLDVDYHSDDPVLLYVRNSVTGHDMIDPLDVVEAITHARDTRGELMWPDQEAVDREYEFPFEISILHDLNVRVTVAEWVVVDTSANIGRPRPVPNNK